MKTSLSDGRVSEIVDQVGDLVLLPDSDSVDCLKLHYTNINMKEPLHWYLLLSSA